MSSREVLEARATLSTPAGPVTYYALERLRQAAPELARAPRSIKILVENLLRLAGEGRVGADEVLSLARWRPGGPRREVPFMPARVLLQDFTGVPAVVDLAAMRDAMAVLGGDPRRINPHVPVDLVIDHSVQVDRFGSPGAFRFNVEREYERNRERYVFLRWGQRAFRNFRVVPPGTGICHQVNLEYLAQVVFREEREGMVLAYPDTLVGTDSHTTMINGLGVLGWGVGGIEAEAVMMGQPYSLLTPEVVGVRLAGRLPAGATATDLVLTLTELLRRTGVVGKFVEFFGPGLAALSLEDRATLANMAPEYGATLGFFPVDAETLAYLRRTGRPEPLVGLVEAYCKTQGLFRTDGEPEPVFSETVGLDLGAVEPSVAGPRRPQDRVPLVQVKARFEQEFAGAAGAGRRVPVTFEDGTEAMLEDGAVVIAAITSCTNTSNPAVMLAAGLLAKKAVARGLTVRPWVKTSLAPGSRVVTEYLRAAGLLEALEALRFHVVGYGCTTCIGNSGPLPEPVAEAVRSGDLAVAAVLSGNRNFEGRIHPLTRANYLASPPLVVAYALAGTVRIDWEREPLGTDREGRPVFLRDLWPRPEEVRAMLEAAVRPEVFREYYARVFEGDDAWRRLPVPEGERYPWDPNSTYIQEPPFFKGMTAVAEPPQDIVGARVLVMLGDSVTTDHISPAGAIPPDGPAGRYLIARGVPPSEFNSFGARRGNHEVMIRGTFANIRLRNELVPGTEGGWTVHLPAGEQLTVFEAAERYRREGVPLLVIAGKEYGTGSSRDWAAKGPALLGVRVVLAESFERIHRSNLVGMGVLPLEFAPGTGRKSLGLTGREVYGVRGIADGLAPRATLDVVVEGPTGETRRFAVTARLDSPTEVTIYRHGGILPWVLRRLAGVADAA